MRIYVDISTGTFGAEDDLVFVDVDDWSNDEFVAFGEMTDDDRSALGWEIASLQKKEESNAV